MIKHYLQVVKPGIILGNMISAAGGFFLASRGEVDAGLMFSAITGTSLVVASACVCNNCVDRNLDRKMVRTRTRALARGSMSPKTAGLYASLLGLGGAGLLWTHTNLLCLAIVLAGFTIYVGVYSLVLKPTSVHSTWIGSLAGATPPLAGYCAVTGRLDPGALMLLLIFCLWQIPHSYAIALFRVDDYTAAAIPILPVRKGVAAAQKHIVGHIVAFMAAAPMLTVGGYAGYSYLVVAVASGLLWLLMALSGQKSSDHRIWARKLFVFSIAALFALSVMMSIDATVPIPSNRFLTAIP